MLEKKHFGCAIAIIASFLGIVVASIAHKVYMDCPMVKDANSGSFMLVRALLVFFIVSFIAALYVSYDIEKCELNCSSPLSGKPLPTL
jgi:hypothetical protein